MEISNSFSQSLNDSQLEAVTYCDGPSLVIAGAGSGKTRVLTYKIAYLLENGFQPWSILSLTFTNKAAREMNNRIFEICNGKVDCRGLWSGTFHSIFARLLRIEHEAVGYPQDFTIYDAADSKSLVKAIVKELMLDDKIYKSSSVMGRISEAKNHLIVPAAYNADATIKRRDASENMELVGKIYTIYQQRLRAAGAMDFDDLLLNTFLLLRDNQEVRQRYMDRFDYILVDEYQDTNMAQHRILSLLTNPNSRICVVGDDAQSIYGFRGADITNILNFKEQYPTARLIKLECNYRSTQTIVEAANCIIRNNVGQIPKKVYSQGEVGAPIEVFNAQTDKEEAHKIVAHISKLLRKEGLSHSDIAVLYRTNAQSRVIEEALQSSAIPYRIYGGLSFYQRKEIKDVLAYCRLITNPDDEEAYRRVINYPARGIGATTLQKIKLAAVEHEVSMWQVTENPVQYGVTLNKGALTKLSAFCTLIKALREESEKLTASAVVRNIVLKTGIAIEFSRERTQENISRQENVDELLGSIQSFEKEVMEEEGRKRVSLSEFLSTVSLLSDADVKDDGQPRVTLMTVHAAKGLEFQAVFVTGMEEELFPNANAKLYRKEMEEERRLFYVAVTRAKKFCYLSYANSRYRYGQLQLSDPSPFIAEIDEKYLDRHDKLPSSPSFKMNGGYSARNEDYEGGYSSSKYGNRPATNYRGGKADFDSFFGSPSEDDFRSAMRGGDSRSQNGYGSGYNNEGGYSCRGSYQSDYTPKRVAPITPPAGFVKTGVRRKTTSNVMPGAVGAYAIGTKVQHARFGAGTVIGTDGAGDNAKVKVDFGAAGVKNLLVKFANLTVLS